MRKCRPFPLRLSALRRCLTLGLALLSLQTLPAAAASTVAFVAAEADYPALEKLPSAIADAEIVADALREAGATVYFAENVDARTITALASEFQAAAESATRVVIYFSGHSATLGTRSLLLPVDQKSLNEGDLLSQALNLDRLLPTSGTAEILLFLDACWNMLPPPAEGVSKRPEPGCVADNPKVGPQAVVVARSASRLPTVTDRSVSSFGSAVAAAITHPGMRDPVVMASELQRKYFATTGTALQFISTFDDESEDAAVAAAAALPPVAAAAQPNPIVVPVSVPVPLPVASPVPAAGVAAIPLGAPVAARTPYEPVVDSSGTFEPVNRIPRPNPSAVPPAVPPPAPAAPVLPSESAARDASRELPQPLAAASSSVTPPVAGSPRAAAVEAAVNILRQLVQAGLNDYIDIEMLIQGLQSGFDSSILPPRPESDLLLASKLVPNLVSAGVPASSEMVSEHLVAYSFQLGRQQALEFIESGRYRAMPDLQVFRETLKSPPVDAVSTSSATGIGKSRAAQPIKDVYLARSESEQFLLTNGQRGDISSLPSGLQYQTVTAGTGRLPLRRNTVRLNLTMSLKSGDVIQDSRRAGTPLETPINSLIKGLQEGLLLMREGGRMRFYVPSRLAYGEAGNGAVGPHEVIICDVELLEILK